MTRLDHGVIGNGRVLALVAPTSAIEWLCLPRFDSPSVFGRLLDEERGGTFRFLCNGRELRGELAYLPNTNVLRSVFKDGETAWEVIDFAPRLPEGLQMCTPLQVIRLVQPLRGRPLLAVDFDPRPDYARVPPHFIETSTGLAVGGGSALMFLQSNVPSGYLARRQPFVLDRPRFFVFGYGPHDRLPAPTFETVQHALDTTIAGWREWVRGCAITEFAPEQVLRAALALKLHVSEDSGAIIAAATTSIPEEMGTQRTWDYRYCWLRDSAFTVGALRRLGQLNEGERFIHFLRDVAEAGPLQPLYGIDGSRELDEVMLPHLAGFAGNGFVRIGNAAVKQQQNDLMGEVMTCLTALLEDPRLLAGPRDFWPLIERLVEDAITAAPQPDMGIWELRTRMLHHTFSRAQCWVAIHRGAVLARRIGNLAQADRWDAIAATECGVVLGRGYNAELGMFTQTLDGDEPDASCLLLPVIGMLDAHDPRFHSTVDEYGKRLMDRGLMRRYRNADDLGTSASTFTICTFWYVQALALMDRLDEAIELFHHVCSFANPLGLFSEDVDPETGALLGNFPQAYAHVGLINAAMRIGQRLEAASGHTVIGG